MALSLRQPTSPDAELDSDVRGSRRLRHRGSGSDAGALRGRFAEQPVLNGALVLLCVAAIVLAILAVGPSSQSSGQRTRTATAKRGVVQSTVSGSGNVRSATELDLGFKTSGTVTHIYVKQGQQVTKGQLLATLDPQSAEVTLGQAKASLQSAEASLAQLEENEGKSTSSQGGTGATASAASLQTSTASAYAADITAASDGSPARSSTTTAPTTTAPTTTTPTTTTTGGETPTASKPTSTKTTGAPTGTTSTPATGSGSQTGSESKTKQSAATREANLSSAEATVKTDRLTVKGDERAVQNTKLYAPGDGTIVSLSGEVSQTVSATGTTKASSSASSSSSSSSSSSASPSKTGSTGSSTPSSSEGSSSGSTFMVLSDLEAMQLVVALSESEIGNVHVGQIATLTIEALSGRKVAAHVTHVAQTPTSTSGAVSFDVTFKLDQGAAGLKVGMSATAEVVIKQAEGVNVPTSAIKGGSVTILRNGKQVSERVTTGLAGDSSTIILSGLKAGETVLLPSTATSTSPSGASPFGSSGKSRSGGLGSSLGGGGGGGFPSGGPPAGLPGGG